MMMNKGTAIVGFFLCFLAGMGLMYGIDHRSGGVDIAAEPGSGGGDHGDSPIPVTSKDPQMGKATAPVTIVVVSDFQCPFCSRVEPTLKQIRDTYGDKVRFVWKNQPLPFHNRARPAADAAQTVFGLAGSDAFWKFHDTAFANQQNLTDENFEKSAVAAGVDAGKFKAALTAKKFTAKVDEDMALANKIGANGTPAFRINGVTVSGAQPFDAFKKVIDQQIEEAAKLTKSGTKPSDLYVALTKKFFQAPEQPAQNQPQKPAAPNPEEDDKTVWKVAIGKDDPARGPADALVTIVMFSDYQCPFCKRVEPTIKQIIDTYGADVRVIWKDNPLPFHQRAKPAAAVARVAFDQKGDKGFWAAHDALFENQDKLEDDGLEKISGQLGLPWSTVKAAIDSEKYKNLFAAASDQAMELNARGTPHFFVNGRRISGAQPFENFKKLVDEEITKGKALVGKGVARAKVYEEIMKDAKGPPPPEKKEVPAPGKDNPFKGSASAKVVIQEFSDFQCPFCKRVEPTIDQIEKEYGSKVKIVWRHVPLDFHQDALLASEAAVEAFVQKGNDGFWKFHKKVFEKQPDIKRPTLEQIAQELGLDMNKFKAALDNHTHKAAVDKDKALADQVGIRGTPGFTINGYFVSGAQPFEAFDKLIKLALKEAK
jgi:protein-disulfide isomerase